MVNNEVDPVGDIPDVEPKLVLDGDGNRDDMSSEV